MAELAPQDPTGNYQRPSYTFDGWIGRTSEFPDEPGRYQLYTGNPCPWCHRTVLAVKLLGLEDAVGVTVLEDDPTKARRGGWVFGAKNPDPLLGCSDLFQLYTELSPGYKGRCTAPLLVDKKARRIVSNESSNIVRMLNEARLGNGNKKEERLDLYPTPLNKDIDRINEWVYELLNNGVYRCGFATTQNAYEQASRDVLKGLSQCEELLEKQPFLCGSEFTEADLRLLPTILRFDGAYSPLFRAGGAHLRIRSDYPAVHSWLKKCWKDMPPVQSSIDLADACASYYRQLFPLNPGGIVPLPVSSKSLGLE